MSTSPKRGIKRKRDQEEPSNSRSKPSRKVVVDKSVKFGTKLHHAVKEVKKASKLAKAREIQRLVKKLKELRSKGSQGDAAEETEKQLEVLKGLDHESIATLMLLRRLKKDKHIQGNVSARTTLEPQITQGKLSDQSEQHNTMKSTVESRLCSSKILANQITEQVTSLRSLVLPAKPVEESPVQPTEKIGNEEDKEQDGWESGSISDNVESDSDEDNSGNVGSPKMELVDTATSDSEEDGDSSTSEALGSSRIPLVKQSKKSPSPMEEDEDGAHSSFLPSLAVGYTRGDSDGEDVDSMAEESLAPRKNRRGQRARQAIWEKKYGKHAKHIQKAQKEGVSMGKGTNRNMKAGQHRSGKATLPRKYNASSNISSSRPLRGRWTNSGSIVSGSNAIPASQADSSLHPSWEAARKRKAQPMVIPSAGKKIVFS